MEDTFVTIGSGAPTNVPGEGVYEVVLTKIGDARPVTAKKGPKAGQDVDLIDWTFAIAVGDWADYELTEATSTASGPKSKMYAWITALFGGKAPDTDTKLKKSDLIGRMALATIAHDDGGWPRIANLGAIPASMLSRHVAAATGAPTQGTPVQPAAQNGAPLNLQPAAPLPGTAEASKAANDLPF